MKRLIDANALIAYFQEQCEIAAKDSEIESLYALAALRCCIDYFEHFPTVDAVEAVHGRWIETKNGFHCSECKGKPGRHPTQRGVYLSDYCPNCGAKMDGEGKRQDAALS